MQSYDLSQLGLKDFDLHSSQTGFLTIHHMGHSVSCSFALAQAGWPSYLECTPPYFHFRESPTSFKAQSKHRLPLPEVFPDPSSC